MQTRNHPHHRFFLGALMGAAFALASLTGCLEKDDGVPKLTDVKNIVVDGTPYTPRQFIDKYCTMHPQNDTCAAVALQAQMDSLKRRP